MLEEMRTHGLAGPTIEAMRTAWSARVREIANQRYEAYGDLLYAHLLERLVPRKTETFNALLAKMQTAVAPSDLEVPLWQYTGCYAKDPAARIHETRLGTTTLRLESVYKILSSTDVLARLASAYGADFYVYDRYVETLRETEEMIQSRREIVLAYYPYGLPETLSNRVVAAYTRQVGRTMYTPAWCETVRLVEPLETPPSTPRSSPPEIPKRCFCEHSV